MWGGLTACGEGSQHVGRARGMWGGLTACGEGSRHVGRARGMWGGLVACGEGSQHVWEGSQHVNRYVYTLSLSELCAV
jgi:hypothetical protein